MQLFDTSETSWHGGKGKWNGPQLFSLISPKPLKEAWIYFFFFSFYFETISVQSETEKKISSFPLFKFKNKNVIFWSQWYNCPLLSKCNLQLKYSLIFSFQSQHDKFILVCFIILIFFGSFQHSVGHFIAASIFSHC